MSKDSTMLELGGLWMHVNDNNQKYMSGSINQGVRILVLPNGFKKQGDSKPDYILYVTPNRPKPEANVSQARPPAPPIMTQTKGAIAIKPQTALQKAAAPLVPIKKVDEPIEDTSFGPFNDPMPDFEGAGF
jgi:hypothetical protein